MVSERVDALVRRAFSEADAEAVADRLESLNLANAEKQSRERIQAAIVLLSTGDRQRFEDNVRLAEKDWRDVLVFSGLGQGHWQKRLDAELGTDGE